MKRFLTIICAIAFFVPVFADIKYSFSKTLAAPFVSLIGYEYQLGFWGYLDGKHMHNVKLGVAYTF